MVRRVHKYADGGKVVRDQTKQQQPVRVPSRASPGVSGAIKDAVGAIAKSTSTGKTLTNKRKEQMEELGLRDGGKVKRKC